MWAMDCDGDHRSAAWLSMPIIATSYGTDGATHVSPRSDGDVIHRIVAITAARCSALSFVVGSYVSVDYVGPRRESAWSPEVK